MCSLRELCWKLVPGMPLWHSICLSRGLTVALYNLAKEQ